LGLSGPLMNTAPGKTPSVFPIEAFFLVSRSLWRVSSVEFPVLLVVTVHVNLLHRLRGVVLAWLRLGVDERQSAGTAYRPPRAKNEQAHVARIRVYSRARWLCSFVTLLQRNCSRAFPQATFSHARAVRNDLCRLRLAFPSGANSANTAFLSGEEIGMRLLPVYKSG